MSVKVTIDTAKIKRRVAKASQFTKEVVTEAVVKYGNEYCPQYSGDLKRSAINHSDFKNGKAIWHTDYARRLYYGIDYNFAKDQNENASAMWAERGVQTYKKEINQIAQNAFSAELKKNKK